MCFSIKADQHWDETEVVLSSAAERPHLQLHDAEVVGLSEAAVVEGVARAAASPIQTLIHPQPKVTTEEKKRYSVSYTGN